MKTQPSEPDSDFTGGFIIAALLLVVAGGIVFGVLVFLDLLDSILEI